MVEKRNTNKASFIATMLINLWILPLNWEGMVRVAKTCPCKSRNQAL